MAARLVEVTAAGLVRTLCETFNGWHVSRGTSLVERGVLAVVPPTSAAGVLLGTHLVGAGTIDITDTTSEYSNLCRLLWNDGRGLQVRGEAAQDMVCPATVYVSTGEDTSIATEMVVRDRVVTTAAFTLVENTVLSSLLAYYEQTRYATRQKLESCLADRLNDSDFKRDLMSDFTIKKLLALLAANNKRRTPSITAALASLMQATSVRSQSHLDGGAKPRDRPARVENVLAQKQLMHEILYSL